MRSKISFFNRTVFWSDCRRYWPLTAGYALLWLLLLPFSRFTRLAHGYLGLRALDETLDLAGTGGYIVAFITGILFAMAAFSYLTNPRATNGLHALPARRETLYVTHCLAGLCCQIVPQAIAVLLTAAVLGWRGLFDARITALALLALVLPTIFFYFFGVFCVMFTGQILAAPVFYGLLNILVVGVEALVRTFAGNFLYGWAESSDPALIALSPLIKLVEIGVRGATSTYTHTRLADGSVELQEVTSGRLELVGLDWLLIYAAVGLVFAALGLLVYRVRRSEATGDIIAIGWARPVFKYGVAFCAALALGQLLYFLFFGQYRANGNYSLTGTLACMVAAGLIGYFAAEMLLKKSVRVWSGGWKGAAVVTALLVLLGCGMSFNLTGYEGYVPGAGEIRSARVDFNVYTPGSYCTAQLDDAESLRLAAEAHRALVNDKSRQQAGGQSDEWFADTTAAGDFRGYFSITYTLRDGRQVRRSYSPITLSRSGVSDPASPEAALTALYNTPEVALARALGRYGYDGDLSEVEGLRFTGGFVNADHYDSELYLGVNTRDLSPAEARRIYEAVVRDVEAGHAAGSLFGDSQRMRGWINLYAARPDEPGRENQSPYEESSSADSVYEFEPTLTARMTETLAVLRELGVEMSFES